MEQPSSKSFYIVTLGCDKNTVDSEKLAHALCSAGYEQTSEPGGADAIIINTCAFIDPAKDESVEMVVNSLEYKKGDSEKKIVVAGCLGERYAKELLEELPGIDLVTGANNFMDVPKLLGQVFEGGLPGKAITKPELANQQNFTGRIISTPSHYAYIKISEGCDKNCAFCIIPQLKGKQVSRTIEDILQEAESLADSGVVELILVAQDTASYGADIYGRLALVDLLARLEQVGGISWIRVMYAYPDNITVELLEMMANSTKVLSYIDMPLQHASGKVLARMGRPTSYEGMKTLIEKARGLMPGIAIRSGFIVGFPGEDDEDVDCLVSFLEEMRLSKVGVFIYSQEEGTLAAGFLEQVPEGVKEQRMARAMLAQEEVSSSILSGFVGSKLDVLIDEEGQDGYYVARSYMDAPDIDGVVYVYTNLKLKAGDFCTVTITDSMEHDLIAELE
ncbi:MAG: 30S ribosomal protein S12 methylthiotransferase RimO [Eubacteriaceae bacterium]|nr:30S ribosomal protein S12 methylthiotransferase RimO [Eubacteriaceae bacterium]